MITLTETILYIFGLIIGLLSGYYFGYAQAGKNYRKELKKLVRENDEITNEFKSFSMDMYNAMKDKGMIE